MWCTRHQIPKNSPSRTKDPSPAESKVRGTNMGPIWGRQDPGGPQVGPMNFAIWVGLTVTSSSGKQTFSFSVVANRMNWQIPQCTCHLSHNAPPRTEMCTFLFWMVHYEIRKRCFWDLWIRSIADIFKCTDAKRLQLWFKYCTVGTCMCSTDWISTTNHQYFHNAWPNELKCPRTLLQTYTRILLS